MKKTWQALAFPFVMIVAFIAADLTGTWKGSVNYQGTPLELTYKLKAEGNVLTGTIISSYGEIPITEGKISGDEFSYKIDIGGNVRESTGKYYGDSIVITSAASGRSSTFKRVAE
ncbi:MAG: hypothetical protein ABI813_12935 [Bacteroidota bacterium]